MTLKKIWPFLFRGDFSIFPKEQLEQRWNEMSSCIKQESSTLKGICYSIFMHNSSLHSVSGNRGRTNVKLFFDCKPLQCNGLKLSIKNQFYHYQRNLGSKNSDCPTRWQHAKNQNASSERICIVLKCTKVFARFFHFPLDLKITFSFHTMNSKRCRKQKLSVSLLCIKNLFSDYQLASYQ